VKAMFVGVVITSNIKRLYRASDPDVGFTAAKFHSMCDGKGPTLTLIKTTAGHTFGGYTRVHWDTSGGTKADYHSFVFTVDKKTKYPIVEFGSAIYCNSSFGPSFGSYNDISLRDNSDKNTSSHCSYNCQYKVPPAANGGNSMLTDGN
jgi:hypothetical protein